MFDIVWQFWTWGAGEIVIFLILGAIASFFLFVLLIGILFESDEPREPMLAALLVILIGFGAAYLCIGHMNNGRLDRLDQQAAEEQDIAHTFETRGHEVTSVDAGWNTIQIRSSCGEVWRYDLLGSYSEGDLSIDSSSALHIHVSEVDSRGFTRTCPPPHEE